MVKEPYLSGDAFMEDVKRQAVLSDTLCVWWLGQSGFLIHYLGHFLLVDPYLSDSLTTKYAQTDKPHVRMTGQVIEPGRLDFIDVVTSSHNHTDHLDADTLVPLLQSNPNLTIIVSEANREFAAERLTVDRDRLTGITVDDKPILAGGFAFEAVPAAHTELELDAHGQHLYVGYVIRAGNWTIYHSGDTVWYEGMVERLRQWQIDLALLPINGNDPARGVAGNLSGHEAALLACEIDAGHVVPCHYDMFAFNTALPGTFASEADRLNQPYAILENGQRWCLPPTA